MTTKACSVVGCYGSVKCRGYCGAHYMRWWRHGDPTITVPRKVRICSIDGCERKHAGLGFCAMHLERVKRRGEPGPANRVIAAAGEGSIGRNGYQILGLKDHPLAGSQSKVYAHRVALYEKIGPGVHPCHWCTTPLRWDGTWPRDLDALTVDHLDGDRLNNDPSNLVPACNECNTQRNRRGVA